MNTIEMIAESNAIEGITRPPTNPEIAEFERFLGIRTVTLPQLERFVKIYQPNARLRNQRGLNVRIGGHIPLAGGPSVVVQLQRQLGQINAKQVSAWEAHVSYESLHPFTDCNGRSGRMLWYWLMARSDYVRHFEYGFLRGFYYQTLAKHQLAPRSNTIRAK